jgi:hypothetical protein
MADLSNDLKKFVDRFTQLLAKEISGVVADMSPQERVDFFNQIEEGYCRHCGDKREGICHCQNDE